MPWRRLYDPIEMIVDAGKLVPGQALQCELCIIGAGAAGITMAREFVNTKIKVCLLEAGGFKQTQASQAIYKGSNIGIPYHDLDFVRLRHQSVMLWAYGGSPWIFV